MGLNIAPTFRVVANNQDITAKIADRLKSIRITDETGDASDTLEIDLADHLSEDPIPLPSVGAELEAFMGYDGEVTRMGAYVADEIELSGWPCSMVIRARSAPFEASKAGKSDLQTQKTRTWKRGTTLGEMVKRIAGEHGLAPAITAELSGVALPVTQQSQESDINLLLRIARRYDAIAKPAGGKMLFIKRGDSKTVSGTSMEPVTLTPSEGSDYRVTIAAREDAGTTVAYYRDKAAARRMEVAVGSGDPVVRVRTAYADRVSAEAAAKARHRERARSTRQLSYTVPGNPALRAEATVTMQGFREGVDGDWLVKRAEHYMGPDGYRTTIECEIPNADPEIAEAVNAGAEDREQAATEI